MWQKVRPTRQTCHMIRHVSFMWQKVRAHASNCHMNTMGSSDYRVDSLVVAVVEAQYLEFHSEINSTDRDLRGHCEHGRRKIQD